MGALDRGVMSKRDSVFHYVPLSAKIDGNMAAIDWQPFSEFVSTLRTSAEPRLLVDKLLEGLVQILSVSRGAVLFRERKDGPLVPVVTHLSKGGDKANEELVVMSQTIARRAIETKNIVFADGSVDDDWFKSASAASTAVLPRKIVCAPLQAEGRIFGVVYLDGRVGCKLDEECLPFVEVITGLAAELLRAARTRQALLEKKAHIARMNEVHLREEPFWLGPSRSSRQLDELLNAAAAQDVSVLITGETGTGKEMIARELHRRSARRHQPFVPVNCAALAQNIIEAELFGVVKGAYTGATESRAGCFEVANGGTLFLDEIGELEQSVQVKLLRVLQERVVTAIGGNKPKALDLRIVAATNKNLEEAIAEGTFREDMYYRLAVFPIEAPSLRERVADMDGLAIHFLEHLALRFGRKIKGFSKEALSLLRSYSWPGNIRELRNVLERAVILTMDDMVDVEQLNLNVVGSLDSVSASASLHAALSQLPNDYEEMKAVVDKTFFEQGIARCNGNVSQFIRECGINRNTLYRRMNKLGIPLKTED